MRLIPFLATGFGAGYSPLAPGTAGTAVAMALYLALFPEHPVLQLILVLAAVAASVYVSGAAEKQFGTHDDQRIVIDEIAGYWVAMLFLPHEARFAVLGFFLFRILDVRKPLFIRNVQSLKGGWGIAADDVAAGVIANLIMHSVNIIAHLLYTASGSME